MNHDHPYHDFYGYRIPHASGRDDWATIGVRAVKGNGSAVDMFPRQRPYAINHSREYAWGYLGSGPAQLAQDLLRLAYGIEPHPALYQAFKEVNLSKLDQIAAWRISTETIVDFVDEWVAANPEVTIDLWEVEAERLLWQACGLIEEADQYDDLPAAWVKWAEHWQRFASAVNADRLAQVTIRLAQHDWPKG